jgi:cysteine synthase
MYANELIHQWRHWSLPVWQAPNDLLPFAKEQRIEIYVAEASCLPFGNSKALTVLGLFMGAHKRKLLEGVHTVGEATSGNTGKVISAVATHFGIRNVALFMRHDLPYGKRFPAIINGAEIFPAEHGLSTIETATKWGGQQGCLNFNQYVNLDGLTLHHDFAGPAMMEGVGCMPNVFVAAVGSGGSLKGAGDFFRENGKISCVGVLVKDGEEVPGARDEPGMKEITIPWRDELASVVKVGARESYYMSLCLIRAIRGSFGPTSGMAFIGALKFLKQYERDKTLDSLRSKDGVIRVIVLAPDGYEVYGDRYEAQINTVHSAAGVLPLPWKALSYRL